MTPLPDDLAPLRETLAGRLLLPGDAGYDDARRPRNRAMDQRPAAVVEAGDAQDVAATVTIARDAGLRVAPQSTGHGAEALGDLAGAVLLRTGALHDVTADPAAGTVTAGAGALAAEV